MPNATDTHAKQNWSFGAYRKRFRCAWRIRCGTLPSSLKGKVGRLESKTEKNADERQRKRSLRDLVGNPKQTIFFDQYDYSKSVFRRLKAVWPYTCSNAGSILIKETRASQRSSYICSSASYTNAEPTKGHCAGYCQVKPLRWGRN